MDKKEQKKEKNIENKTNENLVQNLYQEEAEKSTLQAKDYEEIEY